MNWLLSCVLLGLLISCAKKPEVKPVAEKKPEGDGPMLVGRIASVPADRTFALVQAYGKWRVETGAILTSSGPAARAANLRVTGEKLGQYAAVDIQSGTLEVGDGVFTTQAIPEEKAPEVPEEIPEKVKAE